MNESAASYSTQANNHFQAAMRRPYVFCSLSCPITLAAVYCAVHEGQGRPAATGQGGKAGAGARQDLDPTELAVPAPGWIGGA